MDLLSYDFMQRALLAALLVGLTAPAVGTFLVQRRLALVGDGIGHVALTGVAVGLLTATSPVWTALVAAVLGAVLIELLRRGGRTGGDVALAVLFYGGIAGGVVLIALSPGGGSANLAAYLFGSLTTTTDADVVAFAALAVVVLGCVAALGQRMFAVSNDEEFARAAGLPVLALNLLLAVLTAVTVVVSMRVVGLLLISALMIVPNAVAQQLSRTFRATVLLAVAVGVVCSLGGAVLSFYADTPSGGTIVLVAIALFLIVAVVDLVRRRVLARTRPRVDYHPHEHGDELRPPGRAARRPRRLPARRAPPRGARRALPRAPPGPGTRADGEPPVTATRRPTRQRTAVLELLHEQDTFRSAQDIHAVLREAGTGIGLATVYRTLQAMATDGDVDVLRTEDGESVYRRCRTPRHHHHLVCRSCGLTVEVEDTPVERWAATVAEQHGFGDVEHQVEVFGTCAACRRALAD